jgi:hypothetical protein
MTALAQAMQAGALRLRAHAATIVPARSRGQSWRFTGINHRVFRQG